MEDSKPKLPSYKNVDVFETAKDLALLMHAEPQAVEKDIIAQGDNLIAIFQDQNFSDSFQDLRRKKVEVIEMAIKDISVGVMSLRSSTIGVSFRGKGLATYVTPHGSAPQGTVVFSINWKNIKAFQNWRTEDGADISQDEINSAIYRLSYELSFLTGALL